VIAGLVAGGYADRQIWLPASRRAFEIAIGNFLNSSESTTLHQMMICVGLLASVGFVQERKHFP
jgi:hypothetical protein